MANPKLEVRLPAIMLAYLDDLASIGYGAGKTGVARRFIENGIANALDSKLLEKRYEKDFRDSGAAAQDEED
jgi:hypothetical protein